MSCCSYNVCPFYRIVVACENLTRNKTSEVSHIYHENCSALVCNFAEALEVDFSRVSRETCKQDERLYFHSLLFDCVVVEETSFLINSVWVTFKHAGRNVHFISVSKVTTTRVIQTHQFLISELLSEGVELLVCKIVQRFYAKLFKSWSFNLCRKNCPVSNEVCVCTRMRLYISIISTKKSFSFVSGNIFNSINIYTTAVVAVLRITLCVFISKKVSHSSLNVERTVVFAGNKLKVASLIFKFIYD